MAKARLLACSAQSHEERGASPPAGSWRTRDLGVKPQGTEARRDPILRKQLGGKAVTSIIIYHCMVPGSSMTVSGC